VQNGLIVEEIKHVLDGKWKRALTVGRAENRLEQVVNELLDCDLHTNVPRQRNARTSKHRPISLDPLKPTKQILCQCQ